MKKLLARLKNKVGPLPLYAWVAIAAGAGWYWMRRRGASNSSSNAAADSTLPPPVDVAGLDSLGSSTTGDLPGGSAGDAAGDAAGEAFPDKKITSNFNDFLSQLEDNALTEGRGRATEGASTTTTDPSNPADVADSGKAPKAKKPGKPKGGKHRDKTRTKPKPARPAIRSKRPNRTPARHGGGAAGARPRVLPRPAPPKVRPRGISKKTTARAKPKPRGRGPRFSLPGMKPIR